MMMTAPTPPFPATGESALLHPLERASVPGAARGGPRAAASKTPVVLCVGGFDPCAGAGLLADARACSAFGAFAVAVQTALVPQNTCGVRLLSPTSPDDLKAQLEVLGEDIAFDAVKIGLLPDVASIEIVTSFLRGWKAQKWLPVVVDPVLAPSAGARWSDEATIAALMEQLFPLATLVTPNAPEAQVLSGQRLGDLAAMAEAARLLRERGADNVLLKGGHIEGLETQRRSDRAESLSIDLFWDGHHAHQLRARRVEGIEVRGTGCLSGRRHRRPTRRRQRAPRRRAQSQRLAHHSNPQRPNPGPRKAHRGVLGPRKESPVTLASANHARQQAGRRAVTRKRSVNIALG